MDVPEFGTFDASAVYVFRPGGYALIFDGERRLAVVSTPEGLHLPGGGAEGDESVGSAALREVAEECGLLVSLLDTIGIADELVYAPKEGAHYRKRCTFFRASILGLIRSSEPGHELKWLEPGFAAQSLRYPGQCWAVLRAIRESS